AAFAITDPLKSRLSGNARRAGSPRRRDAGKPPPCRHHSCRRRHVRGGMVNRTFPGFPKRQELPGHIGRYGDFCLAIYD
ncbi:MAG: hypothetical protein KIT76_14300, partial [Pseudolabrys sp.]|nr:hypothetical protein [Pseudolabrys sp.]